MEPSRPSVSWIFEIIFIQSTKCRSRNFWIAGWAERWRGGWASRGGGGGRGKEYSWAPGGCRLLRKERKNIFMVWKHFLRLPINLNISNVHKCYHQVVVTIDEEAGVSPPRVSPPRYKYKIRKIGCWHFLRKKCSDCPRTFKLQIQLNRHKEHCVKMEGGSVIRVGNSPKSFTLNELKVNIGRLVGWETVCRM